jgi:hypothetical protein
VRTVVGAQTTTIGAEAPHVGRQEPCADVGGIAFPPGSLDRSDADIRAGQTVPQPRKADELCSDTAGDIDNVNGPLVPPAQQPVQGVRLGPRLLMPVGVQGVIRVGKTVIELRGRHPASLAM